jgi:hypothetical protein
MVIHVADHGLLVRGTVDSAMPGYKRPASYWRSDLPHGFGDTGSWLRLANFARSIKSSDAI